MKRNLKHSIKRNLKLSTVFIFYYYFHCPYALVVMFGKDLEGNQSSDLKFLLERLLYAFIFFSTYTVSDHYRVIYLGLYLTNSDCISLIGRSTLPLGVIA